MIPQWAPQLQSAIHPRPVSVAIRLNPQSPVRTTHTCFRCSEHELRRLRNGLEIGTRSSRE
eukprot:7830859-Alexandrium_andersonii.AAC.1